MDIGIEKLVRYGGTALLAVQQARYAVDVFRCLSVPLMVRFSRYRETQEAAFISVGVLIQELVKLFLCLSILLCLERSLTRFATSSFHSLSKSSFELSSGCFPPVERDHQDLCACSHVCRPEPSLLHGLVTPGGHSIFRKNSESLELYFRFFIKQSFSSLRLLCGPC